MKLFSRKSITLLMVLMLAMLSVGSVSAVEPANDDFERTWSRTDKPVSDLAVRRTWMWGPEANTGSTWGAYTESPDGRREVQYYDKSRMEINQPDAERGLWYVTNGLLVVEMMTGNMQMGDNTFDPVNPANIPVAGDADDVAGPTYAAMANVAHLPTFYEVGEEITASIGRDGTWLPVSPLTGHGLTAAYHDDVTNLTVASVFWDFMNSEGIVWQDESYVTDELFENPFYATGRPVTEAFWANVKVAGEVQSVLLQCFERRCLTYTPRNEDGWKVEAGNVGRHYHEWRYGRHQPPAGQAWIHFVSLNDGGPLGCNDTLAPVTVEVDPVNHDRDAVAQALDQLFAINDQYYGESGLYNALYASDLQIESSVITDGVATVHITGELSVGGVCDEPRFVEQIRQTVLAFDGIDSANIFINDVPLDEIFGPPAETTTASIHLVALEDNGQGGMAIGCGDSLIPVTVNVFTNQDPIGQALEILLSLDDQYYGQSGLYNALYQSDLTVAGISVENGNATVEIEGAYALGGVCDNPRFIEQIRQTVLGFDNVTTATITVNGTPIDDLFAPMD